MWGFLKNLFGKKEKETVSINVDELETWFNAHVEERKSGMDGAIQAFYGAVKSLQERLREQKEVLSNSVVGEEHKVEARVKNVVLGHRENYCRELGIFLNNLEIPNEADLEQSRKFYYELNRKLDEFAQQTVKSFSATRHLFYKEVDPITEVLKEMSQASKVFFSILERKGIIALDNVKHQIDLLRKERERRQRLQEEIAVKRSRLEQARKQFNVKEDEIKALRESAEFEKYKKLLERRDKLVDELAACEREILHIFLELERALRKYEYLALGEEKEIIGKYVRDAKEAIVWDNKLRVWEILEGLRNALSSLELKEEQENKIKLVLSQLKKESLVELRGKYISLLRDRENLMKNIEGNPALVQLKEEEYKKDHFKMQIERFEKEIKELEDAMKANNVEEMCSKIAESINEALEIPVVIKDNIQ